MRWEEIARRLEGLQTVSSICKILEINRRTAINYVYELRKRGFVRTTRGRGKIRFYEISGYPKKKKLGHPGVYDIINKFSPVKIVKPYEHRVHLKELSVEEAIMKAIETRDFRTILAGLALFKHVKDWKELYYHSKKRNVGRFVGALYDLSRKYMKVKRIDRRIENRLLSSKVKSKYLIPKVKSKNFMNIQKKWRVFIPFNKNDLRRYEE
jgi:hypothetical protein